MVVGYQFEDNRNNATLFEYDRARVSLGISWAY